MKATTKQVLTGATWLVVLLAMIGGTMLWQQQVHKSKPVTTITVTSTERIPMVLLLDDHLTHNQIQQLTAHIQNSSATQTLVTAKITATGTVTFKGQLLNSDNRPYIQVQLPKNLDSNRQTHLLKQLLTAASSLNFAGLTLSVTVVAVSLPLTMSNTQQQAYHHNTLY